MAGGVGGGVYVGGGGRCGVNGVGGDSGVGLVMLKPVVMVAVWSVVRVL